MNTGESDLLIVDVGSRLRQLRQERGLSMRALARESGLSTNALSMIERGKTSPSVSTLIKIAGAMDIPITAFFREESTKQDIVYIKASERKKVNFQNGVWEGLGGENFSGFVEPFMITLESGASSGPFGMLHSGHEFVLCLEGLIDYEVEDQLFNMKPGDSLIFAAQLRHRWHNPSEGIAKAVIVLAGFERGERPSEYHISSVQRS